MTDEQKRKYMKIGAIALGVYFFGPFIFGTIRSTFFPPSPPVYRKPSPTAPKPNPVSAAPPVVIVGIDSADTAKLTKFSRLPGNWRATSMIPDVGLCTLSLQLTLGKDKPGYYTGYSTRSCNISLAMMGKKFSNEARARDTENAMAPVSAILTGSVTITSNDIHLTPEENIGKPVAGCAISDLTVTPFATDELAVAWHSAPCPDASIILKRIAGSI